MGIAKQRYKTPEIEELKVYSFTVIAGATTMNVESGDGENGENIEDDPDF